MTGIKRWASALLRGNLLVPERKHGSEFDAAQQSRLAESFDPSHRLSRIELLEAIGTPASAGTWEFAGWLIAAVESRDRDTTNDRRM
ncbi:MAG: hypothetical protein ACTHJV_10365 [Rhizobiaceae bacterium]